MGIINKIVDGFKVNQNQEDEDYFLDDDYYDEADDYEDEAPKGGLFKNRNADNPEPRSSGFFGSRAKVIPVQSNSMQVTMKKPKSLDDSREICDDLLDGKAVVINLEGINTDTAQRIIDFTYGAIYSIDGDIQSISRYIFIASPHSVELSGDFAGGFGLPGSSSSYSAEPRNTRTGSGFTFNG